MTQSNNLFYQYWQIVHRTLGKQIKMNLMFLHKGRTLLDHKPLISAANILEHEKILCSIALQSGSSRKMENTMP